MDCPICHQKVTDNDHLQNNHPIEYLLRDYPDRFDKSYAKAVNSLIKLNESIKYYNFLHKYIKQLDPDDVYLEHYVKLLDTVHDLITTHRFYDWEPYPDDL